MKKILKKYSVSRILPSIVLVCLLCFNSIAQEKNFQQMKPAKTGYAPVNGLKVYYEIYGEGAPLVLLHGAYLSIDMNWGQIIPELSKKRKVIALELQGHGRTADVTRAISYPSLASDVAGVMKFLKIDSADIFGYSFGGTVAIQLAIKNPELVKKLIVVSASYKHEGLLPEGREMLKTFQNTFFDNTPLMSDYKRLAPDTAHWHAFVDKMIKFDNTDFNLGEEKIKTIKAPVLLVMGDNDGFDLTHTIATYRLLGGGVFGDMAGLPKSQLAILPGKTHVSLMMDTEKILSTINPFLNQ